MKLDFTGIYFGGLFLIVTILGSIAIFALANSTSKDFLILLIPLTIFSAFMAIQILKTSIETTVGTKESPPKTK